MNTFKVVFFVFATISAVYCSTFAPAAAISVRQDTSGNYKYLIDGSQFKKQEQRLPDGTVSGFYSYFDANNKLMTYKYTSGPDGFRIIDGPLPIAPLASVPAAPVVQRVQNFPTPFQHVVSPQAAFLPATQHFTGFVPQQVKDTPEVEAAKRAHFAAHGIQYNAVPQHVAQVVQDTPEVEAAKRAHFAALASQQGHVPVNQVTYVPQAIQDTPEVEAAKRAHFAAHGIQYNPSPINHGGVQETPEVQEAKRAHFAAHAAQRALVA